MAGATKRFTYWVREKYAFLKTIFIFLILLCPLVLRNIIIRLTRKYVPKKGKKDITVGFFHPNCNACTPQENVLWSAVKAIQAEHTNAFIVVYTGDVNVKSAEILERVGTKFDIKLQPNIKFVHLRQTKWIKKFAYLGSILVASEALSLLKPHIIIDTMGYGFVNYIFKTVGRCKVVNYIHNPMVTVEKLKTRHVLLSNNQYMLTRRSPSSLGISKGIAFLYGWTGGFADIVMVNSTYTEDNVDAIWKCPEKTHIVYPPIGLEKLMAKVDLSWEKKIDYRIINASEFKVESNHKLILQALSKAKNKIHSGIRNEIRLILINLSTEPNEEYLKSLKDMIKEHDLEDNVKIHPQNIHAAHLEEELIKASYGIYAKADDHFGSDVIAGLAAGQIMIVHNSGAARNELINVDEDSTNGYLAKTVEEYTQALFEAFELMSSNKRSMRKAARRTAEKFSRLHYQKRFLNLTEELFAKNKK
ncbi:GDP-Man:Man(3)GlcNAc(2)-PP-Dol alpha-1,2-mannosyltransferase-like [Copidosoma floridanum]|uniref:GDP-Man:Man(3)GlcNAc(2)-PP-Dol alpha-1,2-mannosyltransferase-like n=1 Tax=Copidosoma floridanum TaxID=29053 RepID=UPI0006C97D8B|nr:GDP-Man:Man(3)GlcNAc(2)-PP-Dol alpha-1,2-mannosyltransferase-like [Copidosoma floridanum]